MLLNLINLLFTLSCEDERNILSISNHWTSLQLCRIVLQRFNAKITPVCVQSLTPSGLHWTPGMFSYWVFRPISLFHWISWQIMCYCWILTGIPSTHVWGFVHWGVSVKVQLEIQLWGKYHWERLISPC